MCKSECDQDVDDKESIGWVKVEKIKPLTRLLFQNTSVIAVYNSMLSMKTCGSCSFSSQQVNLACHFDARLNERSLTAGTLPHRGRCLCTEVLLSCTRSAFCIHKRSACGNVIQWGSYIPSAFPHSQSIGEGSTGSDSSVVECYSRVVVKETWKPVSKSVTTGGVHPEAS